MTKKRASRTKKPSKDQVFNALSNGFQEAILGFNTGSIGTPLNQVDTLYTNNRWYLISNMRQVLSEAYVEHGLIQTICDVPVDDGLRGGVEIKSKQLDETQVQELQTIIEREDDLNKIGQALKWNRLFGGAGVLIMTDQKPDTPLVVDAIKEDSPLEFRAVDMWELFWDKQNTEGYSPELQQTDAEFFNYYAQRLHKSRVMKMKGLTAPSFVRPRLRGWGFSVVEALVNSINQYLKSNNLIFEVLDEFKLDIFKIKNLATTLMSADGEAVVKRRVQLANLQKNYQNALTMDAEDDYIQKQLTFAGIAEAMVGIRMQIASDMRMPLTKVFGISAAGFSSGEDDIENYNAMVESQVRSKCKYDILRVIELRCQQHFGFIPDDLSIDFKPLRILSAEQEENVKTQKFSRLLQAKQAGEITTKEFRDGCNRGNLLDIQLETTDVDLNLPLGQEDEANKEDSAKPQLPAAKAPKSTLEAPTAKNSVEFDKLRNAPNDVKNSVEFDKAAYEADGGDAWIDPRRKELFMNPGTVDEGLWEKAKSASQKAFGKEKWQFVVWWYKKHGGKFK